ncbi:MAG: ACT domain-containing protein [Candidatus Latescibacterota bacterium]
MKESEAETQRLIREMRPFLHERPFVFCAVRPGDREYLTFEPLGIFREDEGVTLIITTEEAESAGLSYSGQWAHITLRVCSPLNAVGFIAAAASELARAGISVNPVSAFHHDHLFVPWERRGEAMEVLEKMGKPKYGLH